MDRLLERQKDEMGGSYPESIAVVLWGTDNIKTYGESLAQVRQRRGPDRPAMQRVQQGHTGWLSSAGVSCE